MKNLSKFCFFCATICFIIMFFLITLDFISFNSQFYQQEYSQLKVAQEIGISNEELTHVTEVLLDYIQDKREDLSVSATIQGEQRQVFNTKEQLHMVDVKNLYQHAMFVKNSCILGFILFASIGIFLSKKQAVQLSNEMFLKGTLFIGTLSVGLGLSAWLDFEQFWLQFHYLFFTNDLFFLDPATDVLIQMVPSQFFFDLVFRISGIFLGGMLVLCGFSFYRWRKMK